MATDYKLGPVDTLWLGCGLYWQAHNPLCLNFLAPSRSARVMPFGELGRLEPLRNKQVLQIVDGWSNVPPPKDVARLEMFTTDLL